MGHDDAGQFEWFNAWAEAQRPTSADAKKADAVADAIPIAPQVIAAKPVAAVLQRATTTAPPDQFLRDIVEIAAKRDALASVAARAVFSKPRTQALTLAPVRTTDSVPVMIGGVMALVLLVVFGAAASMGKLAR